MRYVILRDDDTNALTPPEYLEQLYRPFLDRGFPVNLATIPLVRTDATDTKGVPEGFLCARDLFCAAVGEEGAEPRASRTPAPSSRPSAVPASIHVGALEMAGRQTLTLSSPLQGGGACPVAPEFVYAHETEAGESKNQPLPLTLPISAHGELIRYLKSNPAYRIIQHGCHHSLFEFDSNRASDIGERLDLGTRLLVHAGFPEPKTFVAPYDKLSRTSLEEVAKRFPVLSTGWFELRRLPVTWWPNYAAKKLFRHSHWRINRTLLLTHPGCLLSYHRPYHTMLDQVRHAVESRRLTVLVTHWWEYFRGNTPDEAFINVLHQTAAWLAEQREIKVVSFDEVAEGRVPLN
jgi:hypothetical protein